MSNSMVFEQQIGASTEIGPKFRQPRIELPTQTPIESQRIDIVLSSLTKRNMRPEIVTRSDVLWPEVATPDPKRRSELLERLQSLRSREIVTDSDLREVLDQFDILEQRRDDLGSHVGDIVVVCNSELFFGKDVNEAVKKARDKHGDKPYYSETVNIVEYPSTFG